MIETAIEILIAALILLGAAVTFVAALGLFRLPDLFTRMHAASKAGTAGSRGPIYEGSRYQNSFHPFCGVS